MAELDGFDVAADALATMLRSARERLEVHERRGVVHVDSAVAEYWRYVPGAPTFETAAHTAWASQREFDRVRSSMLESIGRLETQLAEVAGEAVRARGLRAQQAVYACAPNGVGSLNLTAAERAAAEAASK